MLLKFNNTRLWCRKLIYALSMRENNRLFLLLLCKMIMVIYICQIEASYMKFILLETGLGPLCMFPFWNRELKLLFISFALVRDLQCSRKQLLTPFCRWLSPALLCILCSAREPSDFTLIRLKSWDSASVLHLKTNTFCIFEKAILIWFTIVPG